MDIRARRLPRALGPADRPRPGSQNSNPYSLDSVLRILHSLILAERGGFLLHAASAICNGGAFLFSGVSGAGKTTMTKLAPPDVTLLTDEISYLRPNGSGIRRSALPSRENWPNPVKTAPRRSPLYFSWSKGLKTASKSCRRRKRCAASCVIFCSSPKTGSWWRSSSPALVSLSKRFLFGG